MVDFPHPEGPTNEVFRPAGIVNEMSLKIGRSGWYPKVTFSNLISPPVTLSGELLGCSIKGEKGKKSFVFIALKTFRLACHFRKTHLDFDFDIL